jgi:hypothetical protein
MSQPIYAIYNVFDFKAHIERMKAIHPDWSDRQLRNVYYWQNGARRKLFEKIKEFLHKHKGFHVTACPEAMGVDVTKTMAAVGINLEWPPENVAHQIALAGKVKR